MSLKQKKDFLKSKGIAFASNASEATIDQIAADNNIVFADDTATDTTGTVFVKIISEMGGIAADSEEARQMIRTAREREYPNFGRDLDENVTYVCTGYYTIRRWKSPRTQRDSEIFVAFITPENDENDVQLVAFASFCHSQYEFIVNGTPLTTNEPVAHNDSIATRNGAVLEFIASRPRIRVRHARGYNNNPHADRVFDFTKTWVEEIA